ncbi:hypothetical protein [Veronia pacifica]
MQNDIKLKAANTEALCRLVARENGEPIGTLDLNIRENKKHPEHKP